MSSAMLNQVVDRSTDRSTSSAAHRAERGISLVAAAMRTVVLCQIALSVYSGTEMASHPAVYLGFSGLVVLVSIALVVSCIRTGSVRSGYWQFPDIALAWLAFPVMSAVIPADQVVGSWEAWAVGYGINVAALAATHLRTSVAISSAAALGIWALLWTAASHEASWQTSFNNAVTIPGYAIVVALLVRYLRELSADADRSRDEAIKATRELELQRYQLTVHDATSILRMLSDEGTPAEVLPGLRMQADREARRLRTYLGGPLPPPEEGVRTVGTVIASAIEGFEDLPLELAIELGAHVELTEPVWTATVGAVTTVLHNVRQHADARQVIVHADAEGDRWEIVVSDNGVGFDQERQPLGFGLSRQVQHALMVVGVSAGVRSQPGKGTSVTIIGGRA